MSDRVLTDLQADLAERLAADSYFSDIPVLDERKADLGSEIEMALGTLTEKGGKLGICVVVLAPVGNDEMPDASFGPLDVEVAVRVLENVLMNTGATGTGKEALTVARRIHRVLKHYRPVGLAQALAAARPSIVPIDDPLAPVAYEVRFSTTEADPETNQKVVMPVISPVSGVAPQVVTLTCGTAGAAVYYTVDGSHPRQGNATATLYTVPFNVATAKTVRAAAYKTGWIGSDVNRVDIT